MNELKTGGIGRAERGFVNDSKNAFTTFILFAKEAKTLKEKIKFVNAGERNCSRTFTSLHAPLSSCRPPPGMTEKGAKA